MNTYILNMVMLVMMMMTMSMTKVVMDAVEIMVKTLVSLGSLL